MTELKLPVFCPKYYYFVHGMIKELLYLVESSPLKV